MTISVRQFDKVYNKFLLQFLKEGTIPSYNDVVLRAGDELPGTDKPNDPIYRYIPQAYGEVFDIDLYNRLLSQILLDLEVLFEETTAINRINIQRILNSDLFHDVHSFELKRLINQLDSLLFTLQGADDNFFSSFDNFTDLSKTDLSLSTPGVVDTIEQVLSLPIGLQGSLKLSLAHLIDSTSPSDLTISRPDAASLGNIPGTKFGNVFADATNAWGIILETPTDGPVEVSFTFRLQREEFINRISLIHHGSKPQNAIIATSVDKVNVKDIQEYSGGVELKDQSKLVSLDFEDRLVDYIHVTLVKDKSDSFIEKSDKIKRYRYIFGLKNISVYITGREQKATYVSKAFDFSDDLAAIGRVAITSQELIPNNTRIKWFIAGVDNDDEIVGSYIEVTPQNRVEKAGVASELLLQDVVADEQNILTEVGDPILVETFQNVDFYQIGTLTKEPIFGTASLFRGFNAWLRDQSEAVNPVLVKDNFISFSKGDIQNLYIVRQEVLDPQIISVDERNVNIVVASKPPLYNPSKGHFLTPEPGVNPENDTAPVYAIYSAKLNVLDTTVIKNNVTFENGIDGLDDDGNTISKTIDLNSKVIDYPSPGSIKIEKQPGTGERTYIDGTDYIVKLDEDGFPTGEIIGINTDFLSATYEVTPGVFEWQPLRITYEINANILRHVLNINGNQVVFNLAPGSIPDETSIVLKYRYPAEGILKASVKAKNSYGLAGESKIFIQGQDYILDVANGTIQRLSTGQISNSQDIYIDFKYNDIGVGLEQFFVWVNITDPEGIQVQTERNTDVFFSQENTLTPDIEAGEEFLASIPGTGLVNLTLATDWPEMVGWVQFVVRSKSPSVYNDSLINQIIKMRDIDGNFIFKRQGKYFDDLTALREPLTQVSYPYLRTNVLKNDHSFFSVRDIFLGGSPQYQIIVNFKPNEDDSLYSFTAEENQADTNETGLRPVPEEWKIKWINRESNATSFTSVRVKVELSRDINSDGNVTPKVDQYFVKVSY
jgi:hypothetical protein